MQNLRQFEFLTLAIKISFLFDFCTDVLLKVSFNSLHKITYIPDQIIVTNDDEGGNSSGPSGVRQGNEA